MRTLLALGGLQYAATVGSDEWYRMFLAPLMHTGLVHLAINGLALYVAGRILEPVIGARWFAALFVVSGLAGSTASLMTSRRRGTGSLAGVRTTSTSSAMIWRPLRFSTTDSPQRVNPGSTPITRTSASYVAERLFDTLVGGADIGG